MSAETAGVPGAWWGDFHLPEGAAGRWSIGAITLWLENAPSEWRLALERHSEPREEVEVEVPATFEPPAEAEMVRFAAGSADATRVAVVPGLAPRPVVSSPDVPLYLLPGHDVSLFVGSPVWLRVLADPGAHVIADEPTLRLNDTWFGRTTRAGELCYASTTRARLSAHALPTSPFRATTQVVLRCGGTAPVRVERLKLPAPELELYRDETGRLWTETITVDLDGEGDGGRARMSRGAPALAPGAIRIAPARRAEEGRVWERALSALLG